MCHKTVVRTRRQYHSADYVSVSIALFAFVSVGSANNGVHERVCTSCACVCANRHSIMLQKIIYFLLLLELEFVSLYEIIRA